MIRNYLLYLSIRKICLICQIQDRNSILRGCSIKLLANEDHSACIIQNDTNLFSIELADMPIHMDSFKAEFTLIANPGTITNAFFRIRLGHVFLQKDAMNGTITNRKSFDFAEIFSQSLRANAKNGFGRDDFQTQAWAHNDSRATAFLWKRIDTTFTITFHQLIDAARSYPMEITN
ncbi:hypothetical protein McpSp1_18230 [Methanocorpusculaceae archaeon Sp1]|nr:hypothetical protein [Methanocorpusculaceae archaeon Sp1]